MLSDYLQTLEGFLRDRRQQTWNLEDLRRYTNRARREVAMRSQCIRLVPPISGQIISIQVTAGGSGYTNPTVTISAPDLPDGKAAFPGGSQATATAMVMAGQIGSISVGFGGSGYAQPSITINDPTGHGATATAVISPISKFNANQEEYSLADIPVGTFPGVKSVFATLGHYIIFSNLRYRINQYSLTEFKSFVENYPFQYYFCPVACAQKSQGTFGTFLFYPIPSQQYPWEPDCLCLPSDLVDDASPEAVPEPWIDAVPYLAASYAYEEAQAFNNARFWEEQFAKFVTRYGVYTRPRMIPSMYGRK